MLFKFILITFNLLTILSLSCSNTPTKPDGDTKSPTIQQVLPADSSTDISVTTGITILFSEKISSGSVSSTTFSLSPTVVGNFLTSDSVISFAPTASLSYSTTYTVTLTTGIKDLAGNTLASNYTFSFTTEIDPTTIPPVVLTTYPQNSSIIINISDPITATFSKSINPSTITNLSFTIDHGVTGAVTYNAATKTAIFTPSVDLVLDSTYTATLTTAIIDSDGNNLAQEFNWIFSAPSSTPLASILIPLIDSVIVGDTTTIIVSASHPIGVDSVQYFIDGIWQGVDLLFPYQFDLDASAMNIGSEHIFSAIAYDSAGHSGYSDTLTLFYLWEEIGIDGNDGYNPLEVPKDLRRMLARSTDSTLEFRFEYSADWDSAYWDTSVDLAVFLDIDQSMFTGRTTSGGETLNDIGAEFRILVGLHGADTSFHQWFEGCTDSICWKGIFQPDGFYSLSVPDFSRVMEFGIRWVDIGAPTAINIVAQNALFRNSNDPEDVLKDWLPDQNSGHVTVFRENRYIGPLPINIPSKSLDKNSLALPHSKRVNNPFD